MREVTTIRNNQYTKERWHEMTVHYIRSTVKNDRTKTRKKKEYTTYPYSEELLHEPAIARKNDDPN